jgi:transcriptional regulator with GAF, ATPase, and Fis domain
MTEERHFDERLASIARDLLNEPDVEHTVQRVVDLAAEHLGGVIYASVSLARQRRRVETPASSDDRALQADQLQYEVGEGPCLDAIWEQETFQIDDMITEERYPIYSRRVAERTGIRSSLSFQLFTDEDSLGALNLYSPQPRAFDEIARAEGFVFAAQAAVALRSAQHEEHLRAGMATRNLIGQAQGIVMERFKVTPNQAFAILARISQETNSRLRDVARYLVDTREFPRQ